MGFSLTRSNTTETPSVVFTPDQDMRFANITRFSGIPICKKPAITIDKFNSDTNNGTDIDKPNTNNFTFKRADYCAYTPNGLKVLFGILARKQEFRKNKDSITIT